MERDGDLVLNVSCPIGQNNHYNNNGAGTRKLPQRMPDGSRIESSRALTKKIFKTHHPATKSGKVFIPNHKLPVLDEFGLTTPSDHVGYEKPVRMLPVSSEREGSVSHKRIPSEQHQNQARNDNDGIKGNKTSPDSNGPTKSILKSTKNDEDQVDSSSKKAKRRKRKQREEEPKIIPKEVRAVAGGLPPSFPMHRIKKFTEEYQLKKLKKLEEGGDPDDEPAKKKRKSFVPGLNPRKREKSKDMFTDTHLEHLEDIHPYLIQNLDQNFNIKKLTTIQSLVMPLLLKTRFNSDRLDVIINSGIGTGKILSYVVPIINNLALMEPKIDRTAGTYALVLLPTRELAAEVNEIFVKLCRSFSWVVPGLLTGGERKKTEKARLRKGLNILITTPGRLIDHLEHSKNMDFSKMRYCVMADVHRLLDPERAEVAKRIAIVLRKRLPPNCVRCVVTATLTKKVEKFSEIFVVNPKIIDAFKQFE